MGVKSVDTGLWMYANKSEWTELFKDWIERFFLSWILWDVKGSFILLQGSVIWMDCLLPFSAHSVPWKDSSSSDHWRELILLTWTCWDWPQLQLPGVAGWTCWPGPQTQHCEWHRSGCVCGRSLGLSLAKRGVSMSQLCESLGQPSMRWRKRYRGGNMRKNVLVEQQREFHFKWNKQSRPPNKQQTSKQDPLEKSICKRKHIMNSSKTTTKSEKNCCGKRKKVIPLQRLYRSRHTSLTERLTRRSF